MLFAVTGVSAEWVGKGFTSLRVKVQEEGFYRITYWAVNKRNCTEPKIITTISNSQILKDFSPDCFYTILVEAVSLDSSEAVNGSIGIGETLQFYILYLFAFFKTCLYALLVHIQLSIL